MSIEMGFSEETGDKLMTIKNRNNVEREEMNIKNSALDYIGYKQLNLYSHVRRMSEESLLHKILDWCPLRRRRRRRRKERPRNSWMQGVKTGIIETGINGKEWMIRKEQRRKIKH